MSDLLIALVGVAAGALSTGAIQAAQAWQARRTRIRVAARLLTGELYLAEQILENMVEFGRWPERNEPDFASLRATWRDHREAFAAGVDGMDWDDVAVACRHLEDVPGARDPGTPHDDDVVSSLQKYIAEINRATYVTTSHSYTRRQLRKHVAELHARGLIDLEENEGRP